MILDREIWLNIIFFLTLFGIVWGLIDTKRIIQAPFLYAIGMLLILCPQLYIATFNSWRVPDEAFEIFCIMVVLCTIAFYWGYGSPPKSKDEENTKRWVIDDNRLFQLGLFVASLGSVGTIQISLMGEVQEWRGWAVYWVTLAKFIVPGISLILISFFQSKKKERLIFALIFSISPLMAIFGAGRRSATLTLPLVYLLPWLFYNPKARVPRWTVILFVIFGFIVAYAFPYWRGQFQYGNYVGVIQERPLSVIVEEMFSPDGDRVLEIIDGMITTGAHYRLENYGWGWRRIYNMLIELYVPGGLIGRDLKDSLRIGTGVGIDWVTEAYNIPVAFYTAKSAYTELFGEFSFYGSAVFFLVGRWYRQIYDAITHRFDGRAIIFMCFFGAFPAGFPYGAMIAGWLTQLPQVAVMLFAFHWCLIRVPEQEYIEKMESLNPLPR